MGMRHRHFFKIVATKVFSAHGIMAVTLQGDIAQAFLLPKNQTFFIVSLTTWTTHRMIESPYLLVLGDAPDALATKVALGIQTWNPESVVGQSRIKKRKNEPYRLCKWNLCT